MHIDLEGLSVELSRGRSEVEGWASSVKKQFDEYKNSNKNLLKAYADHMKSLDEKEKILRAKLNQKEEVLSRYQEEIAKRTEVVEELERKEAPLREHLYELKNENEEYTEKLEESVQRHERIKKELEYKKKDSERGLAYFEERLGMKLRKVDGDSILFVFSCIDPRDPDREFAFQLRITDRYEVVKCSPQVENVDELERRLNFQEGGGKGYRRVMEFILAMRRKFKETLYQ
mmetsp:Transcript_35817/g.93362  ORF Transcript_35817/g.93362 Transcript_35817/m.93362 type:complete len:231 (-) Transcript_35817:336-1028(-)